MQSYNPPPPIPTPDGRIMPRAKSAAAVDNWQNAPQIVKRAALPLTCLGMIGAGLIYLMASDAMGTSKEVLTYILSLVLLALMIWLNRALKKGARAAWTVQLILSILGLLAFPLGTAIHAYILSQWFKPENKAWFGVS